MIVESVNKNYGRLIPIDSITLETTSHVKIKCKCVCGNVVCVSFYKLKTGHTKSCGCLQREKCAQRNFKHGYKKRNCDTISEYKIWKSMRSRCDNKKSEFFYRYGGRGITYCDRWNNFENFLKDMGRIPYEGWSLDRIDNDGNYEPNNCRWASSATQARNLKNQVGLKCDNCGKLFTRQRSVVIDRKKHFCDINCRIAGKSGH